MSTLPTQIRRSHFLYLRFLARLHVIKEDLLFFQMHDWSKYKIGIVLSGGGAKGAYEIGCWEALSKAGISFTAIAGTSIGGINGYLMSLIEVKKAKRIWSEMGRSSPLPISIFRLLLFYLERLGILGAMAMEIFVLMPVVALVALLVIVSIVTPNYLLMGDRVSPLLALMPALVPLTLIALARVFRKTRIARLTRGGVRYSLRDARRQTRNLFPVEFAVLFGLGMTLAPVVSLSSSIISSGRSWVWSVLLLPSLALNLLGIFLSSDAGFSSAGEISLFSTERLESLLLKHGSKDKTMPLEPRLYLARLREEVVSIPNSVPTWVHEATESILPKKRWEELTPKDMDSYRQRIDDAGLNHYFRNSTDTVIGLEYVELSGKPVLEAADSVLSTSAIADALGRVQQRLSGIEADDFVLRAMSATFYDPGLVDNTPIAPLLEAADCNLIVVVFLDQRIRDAKQYLEKHLKQINAHLRSLNPDLDDQTYASLTETPFLTPIHEAPSRLGSVKLLALVPSKALGRGRIGFIKETLWFRQKRIGQLMKLGYDDTEQALKRFIELESVTPN